jgi:hypothetical protein
MDWITLLSAFVGGIAGSAITGVVGYQSLRDERVKQRHEQQRDDSDVVADVDQLLMDLAPERRGINLGTPEVEAVRWKGYDERIQRLYRELVKMATGHPVEAVQTLASDLSSSILRAGYQSQWYVADLLSHRHDTPVLATAQAEHAAAESLLAQLNGAVKAAGAPRRLFGRARRSLPRGQSAPQRLEGPE